MATFWESLSEIGKRQWPQIYKKFKRKEWKPPKKDKSIQCEVKINTQGIMRKPGKGAWHD